MIAQLDLALKIQKCNKSAKFLYGDKYQEKIQPYMENIRLTSKKYKCDILQATLTICKCEEVKDEGMLIVLYCAAAYEIIENQPK